MIARQSVSIPFYTSSEALPDPVPAREHRDIRHNFKNFRKMGSQKPRLVLELFEQFGFSQVILSDTDTAWLRDPERAQTPLAVP